MRNQTRKFLGGNTKSVRYKAAMHHLDQKAKEVRNVGLIRMTLRSDKKALIQESDLRIWAKEQGFEVKDTPEPNVFLVAKVVKAAA